MSAPVVLDKLGTAIEPGCFIAYGHALGRCAGIRIGRVESVKTKVSEWGGKETLYRITVSGIDDDWSGQEPKLHSRKGTLQFPERIIVLPEEMVPWRLMKLFQ